MLSLNCCTVLWQVKKKCDNHFMQIRSPEFEIWQFHTVFYPKVNTNKSRWRTLTTLFRNHPSIYPSISVTVYPTQGHRGAGVNPSCHWANRQFITGLTYNDKQLYTLTLTLTHVGKVMSPVAFACISLDDGRRFRVLGENPHIQWEMWTRWANHCTDDSSYSYTENPTDQQYVFIGMVLALWGCTVTLLTLLSFSRLSCHVS